FHSKFIYKITKKEIYVSDPAKGLISYEYKAFSKNCYQPNSKKGVVIGMEPEANFLEINHDDNKKPKRTLSSIFRYFTPYKNNITNLLIIMLFVTALQACLPFLTWAIIDVGIGTADLDFINMMLIANVCILLATTLSNAVRDWIILHLTSRVNISLISDYLVKLMRLPITFFENKMIGDILQRASDHQRVREFIMGNSLNLIFSTLTFVVFGVILSIFNKVIFFIFIAGSTLYFIWVLAFL